MMTVRSYGFKDKFLLLETEELKILLGKFYVYEDPSSSQP